MVYINSRRLDEDVQDRAKVPDGRGSRVMRRGDVIRAESLGIS
ncbi:hypothetical protein E2C01_087902 [Portunus trituberculatus]|uniref:Uncharacterized protein n=1 Tax=Portunus trituberculatus TaxID=210409 RepID=A0A5B7JKK0_PORTR|nr:hypothetical protein [Portunus trituberculatus]